MTWLKLNNEIDIIYALKNKENHFLMKYDQPISIFI